MIAFLIIGVPLFIWIQFFEVPNKVKIGEAKMQQDPLTHNYESVINYSSPYLGDASNTGNLVNHLPFSEHQESIEIDSEGFSLQINYDVRMREVKEKAQQAIIYNSTALLALIDNLEQVELKFHDRFYSVTRDRVEKWFGTTLVDLKEVEVFEEKVQRNLSKDINEWFTAYTESE